MADHHTTQETESVQVRAEIMADHHTTQDRAFQVRAQGMADHHTTHDRAIQVRVEVSRIITDQSHNTGQRSSR